jgi:hypothetical protein
MYETDLEDYHRTFFNCTRYLMPQRSRLASDLFLPATLQSPESRRTLNDLISLCVQDSRVAYQSSQRLKMSVCAAPGCALSIDRLVIFL